MPGPALSSQNVRKDRQAYAQNVYIQSYIRIRNPFTINESVVYTRGVPTTAS